MSQLFYKAAVLNLRINVYIYACVFKVFEYIKRAKAWRRNDPDVKKSTKSYLIVLLVIKAYEEVKLLQSGFITPTR